ncbi:MAG TPA: nucleotidyltransferase domain-containing protein [Candidatus Methylomirabilis sp.]|nr:nucleotidyltransferase domain-containing protein [Candidatus Methylomirabilis sp.]
MQIRSSGSVKIISLNTDDIMRRLKESAHLLKLRNHEVIDVYLFGSLAEGKAVPGSDADIIIVLRKSDKMIIDRITDFMDSFKDVGIGVDIFPYTEKELGEFVKDKRLFFREMLANRVKLT